MRRRAVCTLSSASSATGAPTCSSGDRVFAEDSELPYGYWTPVRQLPLGASAHQGGDGTAGSSRQRQCDVSHIGAP